MRQSIQLCSIFLLFTLLWNSNVTAQDTLLLHYAEATSSEVILDDSESGAITGKGDDLSRGKFMFFNSGFHKSPVTELVAVLMDLEVSNFTELDSFTVFVQRLNGEESEDVWEQKFSFTEVEAESKPISTNGPAAYNFKVTMFDYGVFDIGALNINVGIRYEYNSDAKIAIRATGAGEFPDAENRCFTINEDGSISDFVSSYDAEVGLAIFPVTFLSTSTIDLSDLGIQVVTSEDGILNINSVNKSKDINLSLYDINGSIVLVDRLYAGGRLEMDTNNLSTGIYILNAVSGKVRGSMKVFIP